ncbi:polysaccharide deacetylase family protein [Tissierella sp.]|uniref:polysaccharide deacetylase family protein n=1 Tax=Tissierella sp. TaxID=41274 RepID=UPI00285D208A|nr:polysaccharide deacetylase family protein [Tissierella sp.]MDR7857276.1 polysaccharide deacetylase family protein [Tissierella sp.]
MEDSKKTIVIKKRYIFVLAIIFFLIGTTSARFFIEPSNSVAAMSISDTLDIIGKNSPINKVLYKEIKQIEEDKILAEIKAKEAAEEKRILEEMRVAEEKRIAEEKIKAEEEKRIAEERAKNPKIAYLTFDDGPSKNITPAILDILDDYNIKATFFVIGRMAEVNSDVLKRVFEEGHSIGNHTYSHKYSYIYNNVDNFLMDLEKNNEMFKKLLGEDFETKLLRLPGGSFGKYKDTFLKAAIGEGYLNYDWNALNGDTEGTDLSNEYLVKRLKSTIKKQKEIIVLMHDTDTKKNTAETLPETIEYLIKEGYEFKPLGQE